MPFVKIDPLGVTDSPLSAPEFVRRIYRYSVMLNGPTSGQFSGTVRPVIVESVTNSDQWTIPIDVTFDGPVYFDHTNLFAVVLSGDKLPEWRLKVKSKGPAANIVIASVSADASWLQVTRDQDREEPEDTVVDSFLVSVTNLPSDILNHGAIVVTFRNRELENLTMPVKIVVSHRVLSEPHHAVGKPPN